MSSPPTSPAPFRRRTRRLRQRLLRGSRGASSAVLAVSATALLGFAGLAVEAGGWYLVQRQAATAADLAALAGAAARERGDDWHAVATDAAALNGFATGVAVGAPAAGAFSGHPSAVEVVVTRTQTPILAALVGAGAPTIRARAVAAVNTDEEVCMLALGGGLELGGNSTTQGRRCVLAANAAAPNGISVVGSARVRTVGLITTGTCSGCATGDVWTDDTRTTRPYITASRPEPIIDPFRRLQDWTPSPPPCRSGGVTMQNRTATISPGQSICQSLRVGPQETLNLNPGIYYFNNADLDLQGTINGDGVTLVFTGDPDRVGTIRINAQTSGTLRGPSSSLIPGRPEGAGLVLYRDARATNNGTAKEVQLNGGATMTLFGGTYFPSSDVVVNGKADLGSTCFSLIGWRLSFSGTSDTEVNVAGCPGFTPYATLRVARLVE
jgi:Flp pilus assembly protein TadG